MGVVYEAVDSVIERTVAIKTIRKSDLDPDEAAEHSRRFLVEAKAAGKLNHPHIIGLYDYGDEAGLAYIVMELVQGRELQHYFDQKFPFPPGDVVRLMGELLDALGYSHRRGVIHRDVKPANIFVTEAGGIKLGDFGIARIESTQKTKVGAVLGTPSHMSPEQIRGEQADARSDLYAAGVVLFQFLTGERPFAGTMLSMALKVLNEPAPAASSIAPSVSPALDAVVAKALAKDARERYQTAGEFWRALAEASGLAVAPVPSLAPLADGAGLAGERTRSLYAAATGLGTVSGAGADAAARADAPTAAPVATGRRTGGTLVGAHPPGAAAEPPSAAPPQTAGGRRAGIAAVGVAALGVAVGAWWWFGRPAPTGTTEAPAPRPAPAGPTASGPASAPPLPAASAASVPAVPASVGAPASATSTPALPDRPTPAAAASAAPQPAVEPAAPAPPAPRKPPREPRAAPAPAAASPPAVNPTPRAAKPARCSDILQKASLEPLSAEEAAYLRRECQ